MTLLHKQIEIIYKAIGKATLPPPKRDLLEKMKKLFIEMEKRLYSLGDRTSPAFYMISKDVALVGDLVNLNEVDKAYDITVRLFDAVSQEQKRGERKVA